MPIQWVVEPLASISEFTDDAILYPFPDKDVHSPPPVEAAPPEVPPAPADGSPPDAPPDAPRDTPR